MTEKKSDEEQDQEKYEEKYNWDHPIVKHGFLPEHLVREMFNCGRTVFTAWAKSHSNLSKPIGDRRRVYHRDTILAWIADPTNADDVPTEEPPKPAPARKDQRSKKAQLGHN